MPLSMIWIQKQLADENGQSFPMSGRIMNSSENISGLYEDLDADIMALYGLTVAQIDTIQSALNGKSKFLKGC